MPFDRKSCPARICGGTHDGTDRALTLLRVPFFTTSFFISDDVMIDLDARLTWQSKGDGQPLSTSWSLLLRWGHFCPDRCRRFDISPLVTLSDVVTEMFERGIP